MARSNLDKPATQLKMVRDFAQSYVECRAAGDREKTAHVAEMLDRLLGVLQHTAPLTHGQALGIIARVAADAARAAPALARDNGFRAKRVPRTNANPLGGMTRNELDAMAESASQEQAQAYRELPPARQALSPAQAAKYTALHAHLTACYGKLRDNRSKHNNRKLPPGAIVLTQQMGSMMRGGEYHAPPYFTPKDVPPFMLAVLKQALSAPRGATATPGAQKQATKTLAIFVNNGTIPPQGVDSLNLDNRDGMLVRANTHLTRDGDKIAFLFAAQLVFKRVAAMAARLKPFMTEAFDGYGLRGEQLHAAYLAVEDALIEAQMFDNVDQMAHKYAGLISPPTRHSIHVDAMPVADGDAGEYPVVKPRRNSTPVRYRRPPSRGAVW